MKAICKRPPNTNWVRTISQDVNDGPKDGDVVTILDRYIGADGNEYVKLSEYPYEVYLGYEAKWFHPINTDFIEVTFTQIKERIKEKTSVN